MVLWLILPLVLVDGTLRIFGVALLATLPGIVGWHHATDALVRQELSHRPALVLAGSSRVKEDLAPYPMEDRLGLQRGDILNVALSSGTPEDALALYLAHRDHFDRTRLVVFGVEDWQFNAATTVTPDAEYKLKAGLLDRMTFPDSTRRADLALGYLWRLWDMAPDLRGPLLALARGKDPRLPAYTRDGIGRTAVQATPKREPSDDTLEAHAFLGGYILWQQPLKTLRRLAAAIQADSGHLILVRLPLRRAYVEAQDNELASQDEIWKTAIRQILPDVPFFDLRDARNWHIAESDFYDYGHLTYDGSARFSQAFADWLKDSAGFRA